MIMSFFWNNEQGDLVTHLIVAFISYNNVCLNIGTLHNNILIIKESATLGLRL